MLNFPQNPTIDEIYTADGAAWFWDGVTWVRQNGTAGALVWQGVWEQQAYEANDVVRDEGWLMVAHTDTTDRAAPQPAGPPSATLPDLPAWETSAQTSTLRVAFGTRIVLPAEGGGWLTKVEVWNSAANALSEEFNPYVGIRNNLTGALTLLHRLATPTGEWFSVPLPSILLKPGSDLTVFYASQVDTGTVGFTADWRKQADGSAPPATGTYIYDPEAAILRVSATDNDGIDRSAAMATVTPGALLMFAMDSEPERWEEFSVDAPSTQQAGYWDYPATRTGRGSWGTPYNGQIATVDADIATPGDFAYEVDTDGWASYGTPDWAETVEGALSLDGVEQAVPDNVYGVRVEVQPAYMSPDWDIMAAPSLVSSTTGGASVTVSDTAPADPSQGDLWYCTVEPIGLYIWFEDIDSGQWVQANALNGGPYLPLTGGALTGPLTLEAAAPYLRIYETDQPTGARTWLLGGASGAFGFYTAADDFSASVQRYRLERDGGLANATSIVNRAAGDARYLQLAGTTAMTGPVIVPLASNPSIRFGNAQTGFQSTDGSILQAVLGGTEAARIDAAGTVMTDPQSVVTQEKGDARYLQLGGGALSGNLAIDQTAPRVTLHDTNGTSTMSRFSIVLDNDLLQFQTRDEANVLKGTSYRGTMAENGMASHEWLVNNAVRATVDSSGLSINGTFSGSSLVLSQNITLSNNIVYTRSDGPSYLTYVDANAMIFRMGATEYGRFHPGDEGNNLLSHAGSVVTRTKGDARYTLASSDAALKQDIAEAPTVTGTLEMLHPVNFTWKPDADDPKPTGPQLGLIAQDVEAVLPSAVRGEEGSKTLDALTLIGLLVKALQESNARIEALEDRLGA